MRYLIGIIIAVSMALVGCGKYHGTYGGKYYMNDARMLSPIQLPAGVNSPVGQQYYTVPNAQLGVATPKLSLLPPDPVFLERLAAHNSAQRAHTHH